MADIDCSEYAKCSDDLIVPEGEASGSEPVPAITCVQPMDCRCC